MTALPEAVTSAQNPRLKLVRQLSSRRGRDRQRAFTVEGEDLVLAGVRAGWRPRFVLIDAQAPPDYAVLRELQGFEVVPVEPRLLSGSAELAHPPRVVAVFELPLDGAPVPLADDTEDVPRLFLDGLRDPGNVGTLLRTADAFGVSEVLLGPETADPFGPKAARASMGAIFSMHCTHVAGVDDVEDTAGPVVVLAAGARASLHEVDLGTGPLLCIGSERRGVSEATMARADLVVAIPQRPDVDSLNAATAAAIVMYEWQRQRLTAQGA